MSSASFRSITLPNNPAPSAWRAWHSCASNFMNANIQPLPFAID